MDLLKDHITDDSIYFQMDVVWTKEGRMFGLNKENDKLSIYIIESEEIIFEKEDVSEDEFLDKLNKFLTKNQD